MVKSNLIHMISVGEMDTDQILRWNEGHSGEYGNAAKFVGEMSKSVMQLISIHF